MSPTIAFNPQGKAVWMVGKHQSQALVMDNGKPYHPVMFMVVDGEGMIRAISVGRADHGKSLLWEALTVAVEAPAAGLAGPPDVVVVAEEAMGKLVRDALPRADVRVHPTPELDALFEELADKLAEGETPMEPGGEFHPSVTERHKGSWYQAAAGFFKRAPWDILEEDRALLGIMAPALGLPGAVVAIIGALGEGLGFLLFHSLEDHGRYCEMAASLDEGMPPDLDRMPEHYALNYIPVAELSKPARKSFMKAGHPLAGKDAFPELLRIDARMVTQPVGVDDLRRCELVCKVVLWLLDNEPRLADPDLDVATVQHQFRLQVGNEDIPVTVGLIDPFQ